MERIELMLWKACMIGAAILALLIIIKLIKYRLGGERGKGLFKVENSSVHTLKGSGLAKSKHPEGFIFGNKGSNKVYLKNTEEGHITVFGGSGKGKTAALLIPSLRAWNSPFFAIDISGDISKNVEIPYDKKIVLEPENPTDSATYNVLYFADKAENPDEKREKIEELVMLIVEIPQNANDTQLYFLSTARKIFLACMLGFYDIGMDFTEICKTIYFNSITELVDMIAATGNALAVGYIKPLLDENEKNVAGAKNTLNGKIKLFADNSNMEKILTRDSNGYPGRNFNPTMLEEKRVFLKVSDVKQEFYNPFIHIVVAQLLDYISSRKYNQDKDERILIAIDEFASIGYLNVLSPFRKFRKNGANLCILTQSLADIDLVYSEKERKVILDNSNYIVVLSATDNSTREYFSSLIGKETVEKKSTSSGKGGTSTSISTQKEYVIEPEYWKKLGERLVVIHSSGYIKLQKNFYFKK